MPAQCSAQLPTRKVEMFNPDLLVDGAGEILLAKIEQRLQALLAEHGCSDPAELPTALQWQLLQRAGVEAAAAFQTSNVEMLRHQLKSFGHTGFSRGDGPDDGVMQIPGRRV